MSIKLYVDKFNPDKSLGLTTNKLSVSYNLVVLGRFNNESSPIFTVGKYLCILWATNPASMTFVDVRKNPDTLQEVINAPEFTDRTKMKIKSMLEMHNATYESTKDYVELILGKSPAKPLSDLNQ